MATEVSSLITHIFQQPLDLGMVPTQWKHAYPSPVFKKAVKLILKLLPFSLTSVVCRSMKHCEPNNETFRKSWYSYRLWVWISNSALLWVYKLDHYGIRGNLHSWLCLFLHDCSQQVVVDGIKSSGVSPGSVFGPILFLVYICKWHYNKYTVKLDYLQTTPHI